MRFRTFVHAIIGIYWFIKTNVKPKLCGIRFRSGSDSSDAQLLTYGKVNFVLNSYFCHIWKKNEKLLNSLS